MSQHFPRNRKNERNRRKNAQTDFNFK